MAIIQRLHRGIHPLDLPQNDKVAVGITLPFDGPAVFNSNFLTKDSIKSINTNVWVFFQATTAIVCPPKKKPNKQ